jgi:hypothetical protein
MIPEVTVAPGVPDAAAGVPKRDGSERVRLARLARIAALGVPGVRTADRGPTGLCFTAGGGERIDGVACVATRSGGYDVSLCLICELVALPTLGDQVGDAVRGGAYATGIAVNAIDVHVVDVMER